MSEQTSTSDRPATLLDPAYVAGLVDSCGGFRISVSKSKNSTIRHYMYPTANLSRSHSSALFQHIEQFLEAYKVNYTLPRGESSVIWIREPEAIRKFGDAVGPFLIAERESAALLINEFLPEYENGLNQSKQAFYEMMAVVDEINEIRGQDSKYSQEHFEDIWADEIEVGGTQDEQ